MAARAQHVHSSYGTQSKAGELAADNLEKPCLSCWTSTGKYWATLCADLGVGSTYKAHFIQLVSAKIRSVIDIVHRCRPHATFLYLISELQNSVIEL